VPSCWPCGAGSYALAPYRAHTGHTHRQAGREDEVRERIEAEGGGKGAGAGATANLMMRLTLRRGTMVGEREVERWCSPPPAGTPPKRSTDSGDKRLFSLEPAAAMHPPTASSRPMLTPRAPSTVQTAALVAQRGLPLKQAFVDAL